MSHETVDPTQLNKHEKRMFWDQVIQDFLNSGLKLKAYSKAHQLNYELLAYYVRSYKQKLNHQSEHVPTTAENSFLPVQITPSTSAHSTAQDTNSQALVLRFQAYHIELNPGFNAQLLQQVITALKELPC